MVSRIESKHIIELYIIDFIGSSGLEPSAYNLKLIIIHEQFHCIKYGSESRVLNEARVAFVFILEKWFDQQSSIFNISSNPD